MLAGSLEEFALADVIRLMSEARKTGRLDVTGNSGYGRALFRRGCVCGASTTLPHELLGQKLVRAQAVTDDDIRGALEWGREGRSRIGEALVAAGLVSPEQVHTAVREQLEDAIFDLLRLLPQRFEFQPAPVDLRGTLTIGVDQILTDLLPRIRALEEIVRDAPEPEAWVTLAPRLRAGDRDARVDAAQWSLVAELKEGATVAELIARSGLAEATALDALRRLVAQGLVRVVPSPPARESRVKSASQAPPAMQTEAVTSSFAGSEPVGALEDAAAPFRVAFVCTGNRVRSPMAAAFTRWFAYDAPIEVRSVGTQDVGPKPPLPEGLEAAAACGVDISAHRSRPLAAGELADFDLVIGFEWRHVARAVVEGGAPRDRTFTIRELAGLLDRVDSPGVPHPIGRARSTLARVAEVRRPEGPFSGPAGEIGDPLGRPRSKYFETARHLEELCRRIVLKLFGRTPPPPPPAGNGAAAASEASVFGRAG